MFARKKSRARHVDEHIPVGASISNFGLFVKLNCTRIIDTGIRSANVADSILEKDFDPAIEPVSIKVEVVDGIDGASVYEPTDLALRSLALECSIRKWRIDIIPDVKRAAGSL